jgi:murein DD-endopeptidase MepM/ murein hydrolase activator NlpD
VRRRRAPDRPTGQTIPALFITFALGGITGWWMHARMGAPHAAVDIAPRPLNLDPPAAAPASLSSANRHETEPIATGGSLEPDHGPIVELRRHSLRLPVDNANVAAMKGGFTESRRGEPRGHEAVDLLAPRNAPVRAVEDGKIAKLFFSKAGGNTIYQFDPSGQFCYYYAHLDHYNVHDGQPVSKGDVIGYVGTTGNASVNTPHLHFAIYKLDDDKRWWHGTAVDPFLVFKP